MSGTRLLSGVALAGSMLLACEGGTKPAPTLDALRQPTGLAMSPDGRWLFVTNGNWDQAEAGGTLLTLDLARLEAGIAAPVGRDVATSRAHPCRLAGPEAGVRCDASRLLDGARGLVLADGVGDVVVDPLGGELGRFRLLAVQRRPPAIVWIDAFGIGDDLELDCGQDDASSCDALHQLRRAQDAPDRTLPDDPSRIVIDDQGYRFAYVPHLLQGELSLIDLDGEFGPDLSAVEREFFRSAIFDDLDLRGGFSVAARACDPARPPDSSRDCTRPLLYSTHRFWPGTRRFTVAPGLEVILPGGDSELGPIGVDAVQSRPLMGDLQFEDPQTGESLLVVQTTPGALARVDTSVDEDGGLVDAVQSTVALCRNPNLLAVHRADAGEPLALVTCYGDGRLSVVGLGSFAVLQTLQLGDGANEIEIDAPRRLAYVANTLDDSLSVIDLDPTRATYLTERARVGPRTP